MGADDALALGLVLQKVVHFGRGAVVGAHDEAVVGHVQDQILTHDGQTNQTDIRPATKKTNK